MTGFEIFQRSVCFGNRLEVGRNGSKDTPSGDLSRISYLQKNCRGFFLVFKEKKENVTYSEFRRYSPNVTSLFLLKNKELGSI